MISVLEISVKKGKVVDASVRFFSNRIQFKFKGLFILAKLIDQFIKVDYFIWT